MKLFIMQPIHRIIGSQLRCLSFMYTLFQARRNPRKVISKLWCVLSAKHWILKKLVLSLITLKQIDRNTKQPNKTRDCQVEVHERDCEIHHFLNKRFLELKVSKVLQNVSFAVSAGVEERLTEVTISPLCSPCGERLQARGTGKKSLYAWAGSSLFVPTSTSASFCAT